jgi:hypothetical protein
VFRGDSVLDMSSVETFTNDVLAVHQAHPGVDQVLVQDSAGLWRS